MPEMFVDQFVVIFESPHQEQDLNRNIVSYQSPIRTDGVLHQTYEDAVKWGEENLPGRAFGFTVNKRRVQTSYAYTQMQNGAYWNVSRAEGKELLDNFFRGESTAG